MAGRTPRKGRDEQQGTDPLKPASDRLDPRGERVGNRVNNGGSKGNVNRMTHGMKSRRALEARSTAIITAMLGDNRCPDHLRSPAFAHTLIAWGNAEAMASLAWDHMCDLLTEGGPTAIFGLSPGMMKSVSEVWKAHAAFASTLRGRLGIDPVGYAKIARDLGIAAATTGDQLARMNAAGAAITQRRLAAIAGTADEAEAV